MRGVLTSPLATPFGEVVCSLDEAGAVTELKLASVGDAAQTSAGRLPAVAERVLGALRTQLAEYFAGERREFGLPLRPEGTAFQRRVWAELQRIPYGTTMLRRRDRDQAQAAGAGRGNRVPAVRVRSV